MSSSLLSQTSAVVVARLEEQQKTVLSIVNELADSATMIRRIDDGIAKLQDIAKV